MKTILRTVKQRKADLARTSAAVVRSAMAEHGVSSLCECAHMVGIPRNTFYGRIKRGGWTQAELSSIVSVFDLTESDAARLLGVRCTAK